MRFRLSHPVSGTGANWPISRKVASHAASAIPGEPMASMAGWWFYPSWKIWVNGKGFFHIWKIIQIFETTNQIGFPHIIHNFYTKLPAIIDVPAGYYQTSDSLRWNAGNPGCFTSETCPVLRIPGSSRVSSLRIQNITTWKLGSAVPVMSGYIYIYNYIWLVVATPLKNMSQLGWLLPIYGKLKNVPNHQPEIYSYIYIYYTTIVIRVTTISVWAQFV